MFSGLDLEISNPLTTGEFFTNVDSVYAPRPFLNGHLPIHGDHRSDLTDDSSHDDNVYDLELDDDWTSDDDDDDSDAIILVRDQACQTNVDDLSETAGTSCTACITGADRGGEVFPWSQAEDVHIPLADGVAASGNDKEGVEIFPWTVGQASAAVPGDEPVTDISSGALTKTNLLRPSSTVHRSDLDMHTCRRCSTVASKSRKSQSETCLGKYASNPPALDEEASTSEPIAGQQSGMKGLIDVDEGTLLDIIDGIPILDEQDKDRLQSVKLADRLLFLSADCVTHL